MDKYKKDEREHRQLNQKLVKRTFTNQLKNTFMVSLCKNGILGGAMIVEEDAIVYRTGKLTIPEKYRNLKMKYQDIVSLTEGSFLFFPTVSVKMKDGVEYKFIVFSRKRFLNVVNEKRKSR